MMQKPKAFYPAAGFKITHKGNFLDDDDRISQCGIVDGAVRVICWPIWPPRKRQTHRVCSTIRKSRDCSSLAKTTQLDVHGHSDVPSSADGTDGERLDHTLSRPAGIEKTCTPTAAHVVPAARYDQAQVHQDTCKHEVLEHEGDEDDMLLSSPPLLYSREHTNDSLSKQLKRSSGEQEDQIAS